MAQQLSRAVQECEHSCPGQRGTSCSVPTSRGRLGRGSRQAPQRSTAQRLESHEGQRQAPPTCAQAACTLPSAWEGMNTCIELGRAGSSWHQSELGRTRVLGCCMSTAHCTAHFQARRTGTGLNASALSQKPNSTRSSSLPRHVRRDEGDGKLAQHHYNN